MDAPLRRLLAALTLLAAGPTSLGLAAGASAEPAATTAGAGSAPPALRLLAPESLRAEPGRGALAGLDLRVTAPGPAVEVWSTRPAYDEPVASIWRTPAGDVPLPSSAGLDVLDRFVTVSVRDPDGSLLARRRYDACPASPAQAPEAAGAPEASPYPRSCPTLVFALGSVIGVQAGWANALDGVEPRLRLGPGRYLVTSRIARPWAAAFGLGHDDAVRTTRLSVGAGRPRAAPAELRPLPPAALRIVRRQVLRFDATVWNSGGEGHAGPVSREYALLSAGGAVLAATTVAPARLRHQSPVDLTVPGAEWVPATDEGRLPVGWGSTHRRAEVDLTGLRHGVYQVRLTVGGPGGAAAYRMFETYGPEDAPLIRVLPVGSVSGRDAR